MVRNLAQVLHAQVFGTCDSDCAGYLRLNQWLLITDVRFLTSRYSFFILQVNKQYSATDLEAFMKIAANWQNSNHNLLEGVDLKTGKLGKWLSISLCFEAF